MEEGGFGWLLLAAEFCELMTQQPGARTLSLTRWRKDFPITKRRVWPKIGLGKSTSVRGAALIASTRPRARSDISRPPTDCRGKKYSLLTQTALALCGSALRSDWRVTYRRLSARASRRTSCSLACASRMKPRRFQLQAKRNSHGANSPPRRII